MTKINRKHYDGWAPCFHSKAGDEETLLTVWLNSIIDNLEIDDEAKAEYRGNRYLFMDFLIWEINILNGAPTLACDQWVGVDTEGIINTPEGEIDYQLSTYIQADTFLQALAQTYLVWKNPTQYLKSEDNSENISSSV